jgi:hypothetical protein
MKLLIEEIHHCWDCIACRDKAVKCPKKVMYGEDMMCSLPKTTDKVRLYIKEVKDCGNCPLSLMRMCKRFFEDCPLPDIIDN